MSCFRTSSTFKWSADAGIIEIWCCSPDGSICKIFPWGNLSLVYMQVNHLSTLNPNPRNFPLSYNLYRHESFDYLAKWNAFWIEDCVLWFRPIALRWSSACFRHRSFLTIIWHCKRSPLGSTNYHPYLSRVVKYNQ